MAIGNKIRTLRKQAGMTQVELGNKLNVSAQAVSKWEKSLSEPDTTTIREISNLFNISIDELFERTNEITGNSERKAIIGHKTIQHKLRYIAYTIFSGSLGIIFIVLSVIFIFFKIIPIPFALAFGLIAAPVTLTIAFFMYSRNKEFKNSPSELLKVYDKEIYLPKTERTYLIDEIATVKARHYYEKFFFKIIGSEFSRYSFGTLTVLFKDGKKIKIRNLENVSDLRNTITSRLYS